MAKPIFPYTGTQTEHSPPWRRFYPDRRRLSEPGKGLTWRNPGHVAAAWAQTEKGARLQGNQTECVDRQQVPGHHKGCPKCLVAEADDRLGEEQAFRLVRNCPHQISQHRVD